VSACVRLRSVAHPEFHTLGPMAGVLARGGRIPAWSHRNASATLADIVEPHLQGIFAMSYKSREFNRGINVCGLVANATLLHALIGLDPRGGIYNQSDMEQALVLATAKSAMECVAASSAAVARMTVPDFLEERAYAIRVMLSHLRIKWRQSLTRGLKHDPPELVALYGALRDGLPLESSPNSATKENEPRRCQSGSIANSSSSSSQQIVSADEECQEVPKFKKRTSAFPQFESPGRTAQADDAISLSSSDECVKKDHHLEGAIEANTVEIEEISVHRHSWYDPVRRLAVRSEVDGGLSVCGVHVQHSSGVLHIEWPDGILTASDWPNAFLNDGELDIPTLAPPIKKQRKAEPPRERKHVGSDAESGDGEAAPSKKARRRKAQPKTKAKCKPSLPPKGKQRAKALLPNQTGHARSPA
jgi:hypothetical protein